MLFLISLALSVPISIIAYIYFIKIIKKKKEINFNNPSDNEKTATKDTNFSKEEVSESRDIFSSRKDAEQNFTPSTKTNETENIDFHERVKNIFKLLSENEINFKANKNFQKEMEKAAEVYTNEEGIKGRFIPFESLIVLTRDLHPIVRPDGTIMVRCYKDEVLKKIPIQEEDEVRRTKTYINKNGEEASCDIAEEDEDGYIESSHDENFYSKKIDESEGKNSGQEHNKKKITNMKKNISIGNLNNIIDDDEDNDSFLGHIEDDGVEIDMDEALRAEKNNFRYIEGYKSEIIDENMLRYIFEDNKKVEAIIHNSFVDKKVYRDQNYNYYMEQNNFLQTLYKTINGKEKEGKIYFDFKILNHFLEKEGKNIFKIVKKKISFDQNSEGIWRYMYSIDKEYVKNILNIDENNAKDNVTPIRIK